MLSKDKIPRCKYYGGTSSRTILHRQSHSIPRLGCYGKHHNTYILLPFCILALLAVGYSIVNPSVVSGAYAEEGSVGSVESSGVDVEDDPSTYTNAHEGKEGSGEGDSRDEGPSSSSPSTTTYNMDTPTSRAASPSAALTINNGGSVNTSASTTVGETAYISNTVNVRASEIKSYVLQVSYASGSTGLKSSDGKVTIGGAGGKTGTSLSNNTWGYGWGDTSVANASLTYSTMPSAGTTANLSGNAISNNAINFTKKLVFAAKFGEDVSSGHYRASVMLSLVAEPSAVTLTKISNMQDMTSQICGNSNIGETATLKDTRDNNTYNVRKHEDGNCWMTQNLRIVNKVITSADSDVKSNYSIPASSAPWAGSSSIGARVHYANDIVNGAYYTWNAATAGTSTSISSSSLQAASSICPKGWKLPISNGLGSYATLNNTSSANGWKSQVINGKSYNGRSFGGTAFFPAAGVVYSGALNNVGSEGNYWTRSAKVASSSSDAYTLFFTSTALNPSGSSGPYDGRTIRCVAVGS